MWKDLHPAVNVVWSVTLMNIKVILKYSFHPKQIFLDETLNCVYYNWQVIKKKGDYNE